MRLSALLAIIERACSPHQLLFVEETNSLRQDVQKPGTQEKLKMTVTASVWPAATLTPPLPRNAELNIAVLPVMVPQAVGVIVGRQNARMVLT
jgi:hypothetical protein